MEVKRGYNSLKLYPDQSIGIFNFLTNLFECAWFEHSSLEFMFFLD